MTFARKPYVRPARAPIVPITDCRGVYRPVSSEVAAVPKEIILRSRAYRIWVAAHLCDICGIAGFSQAAHENLGKALQGKVCDSRVFAACASHGRSMGCHYAFDNYIDLSREEARELGATLSARMRERAVAAGWRFTATEILQP